ncbi:putative magnesium transporter NIPA6 isoform X3 [Silene latifolia]|uniref:putative magnesium transporter NIPA6 isoform X3 n=1 Tax=Silene latifolia TaxID=37657 RepID=UPI003D787E80
MAEDNVKGLVLAVGSSLFIGTSFILKKKGLHRAAANGTRAGYGGYTYLREPLWWAGMATMFIGEAANFVAYAFAPAVLVTPLGALSIIISAVLANFILKERLSKLGILGCLLCIVGSVIIVLHAPQEESLTSVQEIWDLATQPAFLIFVAAALSIVAVLIVYLEPLFGQSYVLVYLGICSLMGSLTALDTFNAAIVSPIYYVMFTTLTIAASAIMFKDWSGQDASSIASEISGFVTVLGGTVILHSTREQEQASTSTNAGAANRHTSGEDQKSGDKEHLITLHNTDYFE